MNKSDNGRKLIVGTGIYAVGTFGTKILMFLIVPLYTHYLSTTELGTYDVLISTISLLIPIISMQVSDAVYRWIIQENVENSIYLRITYQFLLVSSIVTLVIILIANCFIEIPYLLYFLGGLFSAMFFNISQKILRGLKRQWLFAMSGLLYTCVFLAMNIVQLCVLHRGVESLLMSYISANLIGIVAIFVLEKRLRVNIFGYVDVKRIKELLSFSVPLIPNYLSWWVVDSSARYIVLAFLGISANGILAVAVKFPTVLQSVFGIFLNSWQDLAIASKKVEKDFFSTVFRRLYRFSFILLWIVVPVTKICVWFIMGEDYKIACDYIPFYYLGAVFQNFCSFYGVSYLRTKNTKGAFYTSIYAAVINVIVNIALISFIGLYAVGIAAFLAYLVMWIIREKQNRNELGISINWLEFWGLLSLDILLCVLSIIGSLKVNIILSVIGMIGFMFLGRTVIKKFLGVADSTNLL